MNAPEAAAVSASITLSRPALAAMTHRIALTTLAAVIRTAKRDPYAAVTRPDAPVRPHQPSFAYRLASLARRSVFARRLSGPEVRHG